METGNFRVYNIHDLLEKGENERRLFMGDVAHLSHDLSEVDQANNTESI